MQRQLRQKKSVHWPDSFSGYNPLLLAKHN